MAEICTGERNNKNQKIEAYVGSNTAEMGASIRFQASGRCKGEELVAAIPDRADPNEDQVSKLAKVKSENIAKNEFQRLRNFAKAKNVKIPRVGFVSADKLSAKQMGQAVSVARASTASLGKFQESLPKKKRAKNVGALLPSNRKRRPAPPTAVEERKSNLDILDRILNKKPELDIEKAVNRALNAEQQE